MDTNYLIHYGIKRRSGRYPWGSGERPYQSSSRLERKAIRNAVKGKERSSQRFIESHTIPSGTTMYRATLNKDESLKGSKYVTYLEPDRNLYRGGYSYVMKSNAGKKASDPLYENTYTLKKSLKLPSRDEVKESQLKALKNSKLRKEAFAGVTRSYLNDDKLDFIFNYGKDWKKEMERQGKEWTKQFMDSYGNMTSDELFISGSRGMGMTKNYREAVIKDLKNKGYDGMVDEAGVGGVGNNSREGIEPIIIFDGDAYLDKMSTKEVDQKTTQMASRKHEDWYAKANRNKKLNKW